VPRRKKNTTIPITSAITSALCGVDQAGALQQRGHSCLLLLLSCFHLVLEFVFFSAIMQNLLRLQSRKICYVCNHVKFVWLLCNDLKFVQLLCNDERNMCALLTTDNRLGHWGEELCHHFGSCRVGDDDVDVDYDYSQFHHDHNNLESQLSWLEFNLFGWKECKSPPLTNNMINGTSTISTKNANWLQQHVLTAMIKAADLGNPEKVKAIIHLVIVMFTHTLNTIHRHWVCKPKNHLQMLTIIFAECDQESWQETAYQIATSMLINHALLVLFFIVTLP